MLLLHILFILVHITNAKIQDKFVNYKKKVQRSLRSSL